VKVIENSSFDRAHRTSYRRSIATIGLSPTVSEINSDFDRKFFPPSCKFDDIFSRVDRIGYTNVTDGRTDTGRQQRPLLRSRGKPLNVCCILTWDYPHVRCMML